MTRSDPDPLVDELRAAWPATEWTATRVTAHRERLGDDPMTAAHRGDLLWAWACLEGDPTALAALDAGPLRAAAAHLRALGFADAAIDDAVARARERLALASASPAGLSGFRGRGPLVGFVRTTVVRVAIDDARREPPPAAADIADLVTAPNPDPELEYMRTLYADQLVQAVREAWQRLAAHDRFLLSLQLHDAMSVDQLALVYKVHRATAARRAASARAALIATTRDCLRARLGIADATLDSILRILTTNVQLAVEDLPPADRR